MKLRKNWKRFWTLDRHHAGGFTLVELIVVIAILAILGGVAVPAYSGYVTKANKQADMTLISEIEHALTLAGYNGTFADGEGGYLVLSTEGVSGVTAGSSLEKALIDTFGTGYADTLKLTYDSWGNSGLIAELSPMVASYVANSNYLTGGRVESLLGDVEKMTGMAQNLVTSLSSGSGVAAGTTLSKLFTADVLNETGKNYGVGDGTWTAEQWDEWGSKEENKTAYGNLLVLAAADETDKYLASLNGGSSYQMSTASAMILEFSSYYAFAATNPEFSAELDTYMDELNNGSVTDASSGAQWYSNLKTAANKYDGFDSYMNVRDEEGNTANDQDQYAFLNILAALGNPTEDTKGSITSDLSNENLFTDGAVNGMYNDYLDAVEALAGLYGGSSDDADVLAPSVPNGSVAIVYNCTNRYAATMNTLPYA